MTRPATAQVRAGYDSARHHSPVAVPIYQTASYEFESFAEAREIFALRRAGDLYSRTGNPTQLTLEQRITELDGGVGALATASGQSAVAVALLTLAKSGEHIVASHQLYGGTIDLLTDTFTDLGIDVTLVDADDLEAWRTAVGPRTRAFLVESIGNPTASVARIDEIAHVAHAAGVPLIVDNTVATPALQRPGDFGADIVVYSATKFLGGHGTTLGGLIVDIGSFDYGAHPERWPQFTTPYARVGDVVLWERFGQHGSAFLVYAKTKIVHDLGPSLSPFNSFHLLQGLETLDIRMERHSANALAVASFLSQHPAVSHVHHPSLPDSPWREAARTYLPRGVSSVFSFDLAAGPDAVETVIDALSTFTLAANIGDARSLVIHPATTTHSHFSQRQLRDAGFSDATIRLAVGLEDPADLIADLESALARIPALTAAASH